MNDAILSNYRRAGQVASEVRTFGVGLIKEGVCFVDVANAIEDQIRQKGCKSAFPVNISRNEIAAHYSPRIDDQSVFKRGDVIKLDVGVHVDGYIADTAVSVEVGTDKHTKLIEASRAALNQAISTLQDQASIMEIGKKIQETIASFGYTSIDNLTGHSMNRYVLHAGLSIPNVLDHSFEKIIPRPGTVIAIEPFATTGAGHVISGEGSNIYLCTDSLRGRLVRDQSARVVLQKMRTMFTTLPFAQRWCIPHISNADSMLKKLTFMGSLRHYPQLIEKQKGLVSQSEHTVVVTENGYEVITK